MSKCSQCRKLDAELESWWDKVRMWCFNRFSQDVIDLSQCKFTQGFGDGYKMGYEHAKNANSLARQAEDGGKVWPRFGEYTASSTSEGANISLSRFPTSLE